MLLLGVLACLSLGGVRTLSGGFIYLLLALDFVGASYDGPHSCVALCLVDRSRKLTFRFEFFDQR